MNPPPAVAAAGPRKFRIKAFDVEAIQWTGGDTNALSSFVGAQNWTRADARDIVWHHEDTEQIIIWNEIEQAWIPCPVNSWIIRGVRGEFYPIANDVLEKSYDPA
jgi:hypothetical protein